MPVKNSLGGFIGVIFLGSVALIWGIHLMSRCGDVTCWAAGGCVMAMVQVIVGERYDDRRWGRALYLALLFGAIAAPTQDKNGGLVYLSFFIEIGRAHV